MENTNVMMNRIWIIGYIISLAFFSCNSTSDEYKNIHTPNKGVYYSNNEKSKDYIVIIDDSTYLYKTFLEKDSKTKTILGKYKFSNHQYKDGTVDCKIYLFNFKPKFPPAFETVSESKGFQCYYYIDNEFSQIIIDSQIDSYNFSMKRLK